MDKKNPEGQTGLVEHVFKKGLCVTCGACVDLCPYMHYHDGRVTVMDKCQAEDGRCFKWCPRAVPPGMNTADAEQMAAKGIGPFRKIVAARACDEKKRESSQNGGMATALLTLAMETGMIQGAILTDRGDDDAPSGKMVLSKEMISAFSGSRYSASGALSALNRAVGKGVEKIGVVGLPCQMEALERRHQYYIKKQMTDQVTLKIGLFCTWALDYRKLAAYLEQEGLTGTVIKCDIPPPPAEIFRVYTTGGTFDFPLPDIRQMIQKGCSVCTDMTSLYADISLGAYEGREGWNTLIIRTETGEKLVDLAVSKGRIEIEAFPEKNMSDLDHAAQNKKNRGADASLKMTEGEVGS
ncbi:MAG: Coenzyme F420 hydrogenase/dehydrogenase, beta subunit C-terminal domain [Proteobacteria bacterium]|nr:Coenzyme F420 hydrogenase/dehydrogenase, beta subunit C-terminal domain [Pseudomonadota bacterium]